MDKPSRIHFKDYPSFTPNLTPTQMFKLGSFGGGYWRPIYSGVRKKHLHNRYKLKRIKDLFSQFSPTEIDKMLTSPEYNVSVNRYHVSCGSTLENWESKNWIKYQDPYGWVEWYCHFFQGRRTSDDARQIARWNNLAGPNGRFRKRLVNMCLQQNKNYNDISVSPVIRQTLQHWGYILTPSDLLT